MAVADPDPAIAKRALMQLRAFAIKPLRQLVDQRMKVARERGDSAIAATIDLEDEWSNADAGIVLPSFMRHAPPVFAAAPKDQPIRVLAFGDFGTGRPSQLETAAAMRAYHAKQPFTLGITLGDNFYPEGVTSPSDPRWQTEYEQLYSPMGIKIYGVLGNHDRYNGETPAAEILYSQSSPTWRMPAQNYTFTAGSAQFWAIDGSDLTAHQLRWLRATLDSSRARWKVVYSHYPLYASTDFGGREGHLYGKLFPVLDGRADVFIAGHHHSMQHIKPIGKLHLFIAGSGGASSYGVDEKDPRAIFARSRYGFAVLEVDAREFSVRFVDAKDGEVYKTTVTKP
jgi:predicted phosphodiesterase